MLVFFSVVQLQGVVCANIASQSYPEGFAIDRVDQAQHKKQVLEDEGPKRGRPRGRGRGCGRGSKQSQNKRSSQAKPKNKGRGGAQAKPKNTAIEGGVSAEDSSCLQTPVRKRKVPEEGNSESKNSGKKPDDHTATANARSRANTTGERSFARRVRPKQEEKSMRWEAIRDSFKAKIHNHVIPVSKHEDRALLDAKTQKPFSTCATNTSQGFKGPNKILFLGIPSIDQTSGFSHMALEVTYWGFAKAACDKEVLRTSLEFRACADRAAEAYLQQLGESAQDVD